MPLATVMMPVRNEAALLEEALRSFLQDPLEDLEVLLINDGSTDGTRELLDRLAKDQTQLRVIHTPPRGLALSLQLGLEEARGDFLLRMDADDLCEPGRIIRQLHALQQDPELGVLGGQVIGESLDGSAPGQGMSRYIAWQNGLLTHEEICRALFIESPLVHPSIAARTHLLREAGGYIEGDFPEDYDLWMRLLIGDGGKPSGKGRVGGGVKAAKLGGAPILRWRDRQSRFTRVNPRCRPEAFRGVKVRYLLQSYLAKRPEVIVWGAGLEGKPLAKKLLSSGCTLRAWVEVDPRKIGQKIYGAPVLSAEQLSSHKGCFVLIAVGVPEARPLIRAGLTRAGFVEGEDACFVA